MTESLEHALGAALGASEIVAVTRLSAGSSRETWSFVADGRAMVLQRSRGAGSPASTTMTNEAGVVQAAADA
ncbi:MAG: phosphotransferase family protein, partial [Acidimicrobiia bacterium]|nr:phosphotransferase family protein [Acidimicrobiia bacterium]